MDKEKRFKQPVIAPSAAAHPKKEWQKPNLQKLRVSLDTASAFGSGGDGVGRTGLG